MSSDTDHVVSLENVDVHFDNERLFGLAGSETVHAVDGVSLDIGENDVVALVGESGCGKTTLGKTAIGVQRPTGGSVNYRGQDIWETRDSRGLFRRFRNFWETEEDRKLFRWVGNVREAQVDRGSLEGNGGADAIPFQEIRRSLQMIHQDPGSSLNSNYTVESILSDPLKKWEPGLSREGRKARIFGLLEYVGMDPPGNYATRYPHQLSGGEQQRVALIRALLMNPDLILADEAISALDVSLRVEMMDLLLELQDQFDTSYLFISHDLSNAKYLTEEADGRIGIMYLGELVEIGPPEAIINDPQHPYTKVLLWATSGLDQPGSPGDPPVRKIDVPDPADPPGGCRFHTRCPEAREVCTWEHPELVGTTRKTACFRVQDYHDYWDSDPLEDDGTAETVGR